MTSIVCDRCAVRFEVPDGTAGTTVFCPKCGARNAVPASGGAPSTRAPARPEEPERLLARVRPAMFRARPLSFLLLWTLLIGGLVAVGVGFAKSLQVYTIGGGIAAALAAMILLWWWVTKHGAALHITTHRTVFYRGLLRKSSSEVLHKDIRNFQIDQSMLNRILNVGTIGISSAGQDEIEINVSDIPRPYELRKLIDTHRIV